MKNKDKKGLKAKKKILIFFLHVKALT